MHRKLEAFAKGLAAGRAGEYITIWSGILSNMHLRRESERLQDVWSRIGRGAAVVTDTARGAECEHRAAG